MVPGVNDNSQPDNPEKALGENSLYQHEQIALQKIGFYLQDEFSLISNVNIRDPQTGQYCECDLIVIGCSGIYVVELKHLSGTIEVREYQWRINQTRYDSDPHISNGHKCKILKGIYQHKFVTFPNVWVESVVVLTNPDATVIDADSPSVAEETNRHNITLASIPDLVSYLRRREAAVRVLDRGQVSVIAKFLQALNRPKREKRFNVSGYETVKYLVQTPEYLEMLARPVGVKGVGLHRLRVFRFIQEAQSERERFRKMALNTLSAVSQISDKSFILEVVVQQTEEGDIVEISEWSDAGTLRDLIHESKGAWPLRETLKVCSNLASALQQAHQQLIIHRAVKPENVLMKNRIPKLMNFDLAFQLEDNRLTVMPDPNRAKDDGCVAPEILFGEDIDESTDFFSLGVIAYQLLTGQKPFASTRAFVAQGGKLSAESLEKLEAAGVPNKIIDAIDRILVGDRTKRTKEVERFISALTLDESADEIDPNKRLEPSEIFDVWEIIEFIGEGRGTQVYKTRSLRGRVMALKVFDYGTPLERVFREIDIGATVISPYVVHYDPSPVNWKQKRYCAVMDYISGKTLRTLIDEETRPDRASLDRVARALMEGIRTLHENKDEHSTEKPIIHGDIKPENIIITADGKPVLIDLELAGPPRVEIFQGTSAYIPPYSIVGAEREFSCKGDLFALGVTLWEWIFGEKPYSNPAIGDVPVVPTLPPEFQDLQNWLLKSVATRPEEGFGTIDEMWRAFNESKRQHISVAESEETETVDDTSVLAEIPITSDTHNCFVDYLNTLSAFSAGNENAIAEYQIRNKYFRRIHVSSPITEEVYRLLMEGNNVILTGNAGDGKTTIAIDVLKKIVGHDIDRIAEREDVSEHDLVIVKDMSELPKETRAAVLQEALRNHGTKYLIVSNTGTLIDAFDLLRGILGNQFHDILAALGCSEPTQIAGNRFYLINIGQIDSIDTACQVFKRMLEPNNWTRCDGCAIYDKCPICRNVRLIKGNLEVVLERIYYLYKCLYEYGHRLTMRQMTGHLAYSLTGGLDCAELNNMSLLKLREFDKLVFHNLFFGDDGCQVLPEAMRLFPIRIIQQTAFGRTLLPKFERAMWLSRQATYIFDEESRKTYETLIKDDSLESRRQIRRLAYFCGRFEGQEGKRFVEAFLGSPMLLNYLSITEDGHLIPLRKMCVQVLHILQEQFLGLQLPEGSWGESNDLYITLRPPGKTVATQMVIARFLQDDFELTMKPRYQCSHAAPSSNTVLYLTYKPNRQIELELDLPFFDYVARRYQGERTHELSMYYANRLEDFKAKLLLEYRKKSRLGSNHTLRLLRIRSDRRFEELRLNLEENRLEAI